MVESDSPKASAVSANLLASQTCGGTDGDYLINSRTMSCVDMMRMTMVSG